MDICRLFQCSLAQFAVLFAAFPVALSPFGTPCHASPRTLQVTIASYAVVMKSTVPYAANLDSMPTNNVGTSDGPYKHLGDLRL